jgi:hypothetical protein
VRATLCSVAGRALFEALHAVPALPATNLSAP